MLVVIVNGRSVEYPSPFAAARALLACMDTADLKVMTWHDLVLRELQSRTRLRKDDAGIGAAGEFGPQGEVGSHAVLAVN